MRIHSDYDASIVGRNLKMLRLANGYTAENLREYLGFGSVQAVYKYERGECMPSFGALMALMELYGAGIRDIVVDPMECIKSTCMSDRERRVFSYFVAAVMLSRRGMSHSASGSRRL